MKFITFLYIYLAKLHYDKKGASAIEYAVIAGLIVVALIAGFAILGPGLATTFQNVVDTMTGS